MTVFLLPYEAFRQLTHQRERFSFDRGHLGILEGHYQQSSYPNQVENEAIAEECNAYTGAHGLDRCGPMTATNVNHWFANRCKRDFQVAYRRVELEWMQNLPNAATNQEFQCRFWCRFCKFATKDPRLLLRHLDIQACLRPFQCQHCPKAFYNKYGRTRHEKTHANKTSGRSPSTLELEGPARGDDKPYMCQLCSKALGSKTGWRSHLRMHTGHGLYECPMCSKAFVDRTALGIHMRRHTGDKPFGCGHCSKRFASKGEVRIHTKAHERHAVQVPTLPGGKQFQRRPKALQ